MYNFLIQRSRKMIFFIKNPNLTKKKKKNSGGWKGRGWVSDFFSKEFKSENKKCYSM